jgi:hypothetical protein
MLPYKAMNLVASGFSLLVLAVLWAVSAIVYPPLRVMISFDTRQWVFHSLLLVSLSLSAYGWYVLGHDLLRFFDFSRNRQRASSERPGHELPHTTGERAGYGLPPPPGISGATLVWRIFSIIAIGILTAGFASTYDIARDAKRDAAAMSAEVHALREEVGNLTDKLNDVSEFLHKRKAAQKSQEEQRRYQEAIDMLQRPRVQPQNFAERSLPSLPEVR